MPLLLLATPAAMPATCVPCPLVIVIVPWLTVTEPSLFRTRSAMCVVSMLAFKSSWSVRMPESSMAMETLCSARANVQAL